ncbi:hypothetical protein AMTR_s00043p00142060 [Amborella trichopoda]|uniref:Uncharacterized protein n=1 Tax=Amborella trichopoda TaxID=13333 RepID=W1PXM6_AMBTC|nr:hypothetical protein AMTR_s00043p00142060 [Amborella trichopoda]
MEERAVADGEEKVAAESRAGDRGRAAKRDGLQERGSGDMAEVAGRKKRMGRERGDEMGSGSGSDWLPIEEQIEEVAGSSVVAAKVRPRGGCTAVREEQWVTRQ